jgi:hypothetical protein
VGGEPDDRQARIIDQMVHAEWQAVKIEAEADATTSEKARYGRLKLAAEYRRQLLLLDRDLAVATRRAASTPEEPAPILDPVTYSRFLDGER